MKGHSPRNFTSTKLLTKTAPTSSRATSSMRLPDRHAGQGAGIGVEQGQRAAVEAGREDHAFAQAEAHLARRQVGDEDDLAAHQHLRLGVAAADTGEDLPLAELAGVEQETQQFVGALDEAALEHLADAQIELGEVVDAD